MIAYRDFSECFSDKLQTKGRPIVGQIELTSRCNLKCIHCYIPRKPDKSGNYCSRSIHGAEELSYSEIIDILNQIQKEGCLWLTLTGGEPLIRKDFLDIYTYAKKKGFLVTLFTNGTLITEEIADYLKEYPPFKIEVTLNGITEETYEKITGVPGSFQKCLRGIQILLERNLPLTLKSNGMRLNQNEILKIREYAEGLGAKFRYDSIILPKLDGSKEPCQLRLSPEEIIGIEYQDDKMREEWRKWFKSDHSLQDSDNLFRCGDGLFNIDPYGELQLCYALRKPSFNLRQGSFKKGFYHFLSEIRSTKYQSDSKCKDCKIWWLCHQCPARAQLENGNQEKPIEYFCRLAHKREEMKHLLGK